MSEVWKEVVADWQGESSFIGRNPSGGTVRIGALGEKPGVSPMEMLLLGVAGCTGMDIVSILKKKRQKLEKFQVQVRGIMAEDYPKIYQEIEVIYLLWGDGIDPKAVEQAIQLSEEKYCSVGIMLRAAATMRSSFVINKPTEENPG